MVALVRDLVAFLFFFLFFNNRSCFNIASIHFVQWFNNELELFTEIFSHFHRYIL